ncbi:hypothetical protein BBO99_00008304 [Phytophthora kernoviae]|uniref:SWIM-type domain-containing protein n=2 Tax=Phytophthora kernoviae TaxID=325452 RepID=A0A421GFF5_9STRA|nr:hypothetical protein G195_009945 [Phytophthora kernoviae 00238/432]KAG2512454.1 hypothetical protein JM16_008042 [Phytophthora kernoviae]KAG2516556.1 hypothetical protein JM18_007940 [Phytophthora kernoviae]RLN46395.1 hypothetical protein BBI17_008557 [Phytophthora kernoviae]RLN75463.1 hypothetical protein BBO99_00008304 [Phytophthora kernoviae]
MSDLADTSGETWQAPDMEKRQFKSWEAFFTYMDEYQQRTTQRVRARQPGLVQSVEERLASYVNEFAAQDGNVAKIFVDDQKVLSSITLQTKHMRKIFEAFPEVLRVDDMSSTVAGSSGSSYRVFSLMAHDTFSNWQYVQHAIVENGHSETLRAALNQFKAHNQRHNRIRALIVRDGDAPVLPELLGCFPLARVLYSQFHVLHALHDAIATHGRDLSSWHRDRLAGITQMLVYAPTSSEYAANISKMGDVLGVQHPFFRHFLEKWDSCRDRWTTFAREGVTTFSIAAGGDQFAPTWKAIFDAANDEFALDETVAAIRYYQAVVERAFVSDIRCAVTNANSTTIWRGGNNSDEYDAEMRLLAATVSPAASNLIFPQYHHAASRARYQFCEPTRGSFFISAVTLNDAFNDEATKEFCVEAERGWQCSCAFMVNHHLPCRHVFYIRRIVRCSCVIPIECIEPRWVLEKAQRFFDAPQVGGSARGILREAWLKSEPESDFERRNVITELGAWQKFVTGLEVGKRIGKRMMEMGPAEFDHALRFYKLVETTMNTRPFDVNSSAVAAQINNHATQSAALAGVVSRLNTAAHVPMSTSTPHVAAPATAGTVYVSANDNLAVAARAMNIRVGQSELTKAPTSVSRSTSKSQDVIDLADDETEEEKEGHNEQNGQIASAGRATSVSEQEKASVEIEGGPASNGNKEQEHALGETEPDAEKEGGGSKTGSKVAGDDDEYDPDQDVEYDEEEYDEDYVEEAGEYDEEVEEDPSGRLEGKV